MTHRATGRYDIQSPNCNIYKAIYPEAVRLEGLRLLKYFKAPTDCSELSHTLTTEMKVVGSGLTLADTCFDA